MSHNIASPFPKLSLTQAKRTQSSALALSRTRFASNKRTQTDPPRRTLSPVKPGNQDNDLDPQAAVPETPTMAEFKASLSAAIAAMLSFKDDVGYPLSMGATGLVFVCPPPMYLMALESLVTTIAGTVNPLSNAAKVLAFPWLSTDTTWYICKTDGGIRPFVFQDREGLEFKALAEGSEEEFKREKYLYGVRGRYALTYGRWEYAIRNVFHTP